MQLKKIQINGFSTFNNFELEFKDDLNIIVGNNGVGKTNLLNILSYSLSYNYYKNLNNYINKNINDNKIIINIALSKNEQNILADAYIFIYCVKLLREIIIPYRYNLNENDFINLLLEIKNLNFSAIKIEYKLINNVIMRFLDIENFCCNLQCKLIDNIFHHNMYCNKNCIFNKIYNFINKSEKFIHDNLETAQYSINLYLEMLKHIKQDELKINIKNYNDEINLANDDEFNQNKNTTEILDLRNISINNQKILMDYGILILLLINRSINNALLPTYLSANDIINNSLDLARTNYTIHEKNNIIDCITELSYEYELRDILHSIKNDDINTYNKIQNSFHNITNKIFDIKIIENDLLVNDYKCNIILGNEYYECSRGEYSIIYFLMEYYNGDNKIYLMDEPLQGVSSQYKKKLLNLLYSNDNNLNNQLINDNIIVDNHSSNEQYINKYNMSQYLIVTHDIEFIDYNTCNNIIYLSSKNNITKAYNLFNFNQKERKIIFENPSIFFCDKILLVEGYDDYVFYKSLLNENKIYEYNLIILDGCGSKIWKILEKLEIKYKAIYDIDKFTGKKKGNNMINKISLKFITERSYNLDDTIKKNIDDILINDNIDYMPFNVISTIINKGYKSIRAYHIYLLKIYIKNKYRCNIIINDIDFNKANNKYNKNFNKIEHDKLLVILNNIEDKITFDDFKSEYNILFQDFEEQAKIKNIKLDAIDNFFVAIKQNYQNISYNDVDTNNLVITNIDNNCNDTDKLINLMNHFNLDIYILDSNIVDLEGLKSHLWHENVGKNKTTRNIKNIINKIKEHIECQDEECIIEKIINFFNKPIIRFN